MVGLDLEKFGLDLKSTELKDKVRSDYRNGTKAKVKSTPTFFINGEMIELPQNYEEFKSIVEGLLNQNG